MQPSKHPIDKYFERITSYHYYIFALLFIAKLPVFWHVLNFLFLSPKMSFVCEGKNSTGDQCPCPPEKIIWDKSVFTETIQTKYGIVCKANWTIILSRSMIYVGLLIGAFSFGFLADRFGRLSAFSLSCLTTAISGCLVTVMPNMAAFIFMRIIEGTGAGGAIVTGYVLLIEYCGTNYREVVSALYHVPINVSHMSLPGVSYIFRHCDVFQIVVSIPMFLCVTIWYFAQESPKWLMDNGDVVKATKVMEKIMKFNHQPTENIKAELEAYHASNPSSKATKLKFWAIFKYKNHTINFACMAFIYYVCGMGYYGVSQYIGEMTNNVHQSVAISGGLLIPGTLTTAVLLQILGRKPFLMGTSFLAGTLMIIVISLHPENKMARVLTASLCNTFFFMSFIIVFLYGVELFPTSIRNSVLGVLSVLSRVGQICAPPINSLSEYYAGLVFGVMAIIGGLLCIPLPETKNRALPSTLEDKNTPTPTPTPTRRISKDPGEESVQIK